MSRPNTIPFPELPNPTPPGMEDWMWDMEGGSPPNIQHFNAVADYIMAHPEIALPADWVSLSGPTQGTAYFCWDVNGCLVLTLRRVVRIGEVDTVDAGGVWSEDISVYLDGTDLLDIQGTIDTANHKQYQSNRTTIELAAYMAAVEKTNRRLNLIRDWTNSSVSATIPWGEPHSGQRRDIADCLDALECCGPALHRRRPDWIRIVSEALDIYPVARAGLVQVIRDLGLGDEFCLGDVGTGPMIAGGDGRYLK